MKRILTMMAACLAMAAGAAAQNPIFLNKAYNSDPQARVWTIDGKPVEHANQIDPSVFIDDDGQGEQQPLRNQAHQDALPRRCRQEPVYNQFIPL